MPGGTVVGEPESPKFDPGAHAKKAVIDVLFDFVSPGQEQQLGTDRGLKDEIDRQGGYRELGEEGDKRHIRHLDGGNAEANAMFEHLTGNPRYTTGNGNNPRRSIRHLSLRN